MTQIEVPTYLKSGTSGESHMNIPPEIGSNPERSNEVISGVLSTCI